MRTNEYTYTDVKDNVIHGMQLMKSSSWKLEMVTDYLTDDDEYYLDGVFMALTMIAIGEYEVKHNMLEERVSDQLCHFIPEFQNGAYDDELFPEEYEQLKKDVDYILTKLTLYEVHKVTDDD